MCTALEIKPHPLKSSILKSYRLWQVRKLLGGRPSEGQLCRFLNGIDEMPVDLEASLKELLKQAQCERASGNGDLPGPLESAGAMSNG
jgi:hypothetical protein